MGAPEPPPIWPFPMVPPFWPVSYWMGAVSGVAGTAISGGGGTITVCVPGRVSGAGCALAIAGPDAAPEVRVAGTEPYPAPAEFEGAPVLGPALPIAAPVASDGAPAPATSGDL